MLSTFNLGNLSTRMNRYIDLCLSICILFSIFSKQNSVKPYLDTIQVTLVVTVKIQKIEAMIDLLVY